MSENNDSSFSRRICGGFREIARITHDETLILDDDSDEKVS